VPSSRCPAAGDTDEHPHRQSAVQHGRICDRGQALSAADASQARAAVGRDPDTAAACDAAPWVDVSRFGSSISGPTRAICEAGDLLAAILALLALCAVVRRSSRARPLVGLFNIVGTIDLISAISLATLYRAAPYMGPAYWIPAFWVPALLVTHYVVFVLLGKRWYGPM
jgi:hypothetical protein